MQNVPVGYDKYSLNHGQSLSSSNIQPNLTSGQIDQIVNSHNQYRATVEPPAKQMPNLTWSNKLADNSQKWADKCTWSHSQTPGYGENLYVTSKRTPDVSKFDVNQAVNSWGSEKPYYNYATNSCEPSKVCGHYTQMVWANTKDVGCAVKDCGSIQNLPNFNGGTLVVCQYSPPGNYVGQKPYVSK